MIWRYCLKEKEEGGEHQGGTRKDGGGPKNGGDASGELHPGLLPRVWVPCCQNLHMLKKLEAWNFIDVKSSSNVDT